MLCCCCLCSNLFPLCSFAETPESIMMSKTFDLIRKATGAQDIGKGKGKKVSAGHGVKSVATKKNTSKDPAPVNKERGIVLAEPTTKISSQSMDIPSDRSSDSGVGLVRRSIPTLAIGKRPGEGQASNQSKHLRKSCPKDDGELRSVRGENLAITSSLVSLAQTVPQQHQQQQSREVQQHLVATPNGVVSRPSLGTSL